MFDKLKRHGEDARRITAYRNNLTGSDSLRMLLIGKVSKSAISFPLLFLTLLCCLRDGEASVVRRSPEVVNRAGECREVFNAEAHTYAAQILEKANQLGGLPSLQIDLPKWGALGTNALEMFLAARLSKTRGGHPDAIVPEPTMEMESPVLDSDSDGHK